MPTIQIEIKERICQITLNRPEKFNAFNREMALDLQEALDRVAMDKHIRAVYLTGAGKAFCSGQDLGELIGPDAPGFGQILSEHYNPIVRRIRNLEKPVLAAVNGVAAGAGANIALCCDIVVAAHSSSFVQAFSKVGLIPDSGGTFFLPRLIGFQKASALSMLGERLNAIDAEKMGLVYKVYPDGEFAAESWKLTLTVSLLPTRALAYIKKALNASMANSFEEQLALEDQLQQAAGQTEDYREGISAFLEKRPPNFKGE